MNLIYVHWILSNLLFTFLYNMIKCELVRHKALVALNLFVFLFFSHLKKENMQTHMSVIDLQAQLSTENNWSQICNNDKKFCSYICYFRNLTLQGNVL